MAASDIHVVILAAGQGTRLTVRCVGSDEAEALNAVSALFAGRFGEGE